MTSELEIIDKILNFLHQAGKLKFTYRFNEVAALKNKESSAAHSWRLALLAMVVTRELKLKLKLERVLQLAIIHDLAEAITGDIDFRLIKNGIISQREKQKRETKAINRLKQSLPGTTGRLIDELWHEYEKNHTPEARFIKALDKLETTIQFIEAGAPALDAPEMIASYADQTVKNCPELKILYKQLKIRLKTEFIKAGIAWKKAYDS